MDGDVLYVATAEAGDEEMRRRIQKHKSLRPAGWKTLEVTTDVGQQIAGNMGNASVVLIDCITLLVNNILCRHFNKAGEQTGSTESVEKQVMAEITHLIETMADTDTSFIIVSNEVGCGLIPANAMGRLYSDLLGKTNQMLAGAVDQAYLMVAGLPLRLKPPQD
jgi:adenosylcobinamide kinase/adenosylcobinamide-phosphate guanylyltransferase